MNNTIQQTAILKEYSVSIDLKSLRSVKSIEDLVAGSVLVLQIGNKRFNAYEIAYSNIKEVVLKNLLGRYKGNQYTYEKVDFDERFKSSRKFEFNCP